MEGALQLQTATESRSLVSLILEASLLVQLVMLLLLVASLVSWAMIFNKWLSMKALTQAADEFEDTFWSGGDLSQIYRECRQNEDETAGMESVFMAGYREYQRLARLPDSSKDLVEGVHRAMRVALSREVEILETHLSFLATVGSTSPYVGLFGTVWGIMNSFRSLGVMQQATIATVAPGIAEALIATAMGLFAAIPAVIAYNRYSNAADRLATRYDVFAEEFLSLVSHSRGR